MMQWGNVNSIMQKAFGNFVEGLKASVNETSEDCLLYESVARMYENYFAAGSAGDLDYDSFTLDDVYAMEEAVAGYLSWEDLDCSDYTNDDNDLHGAINVQELKLLLSRVAPPREEVEYF